jgi:hypothetical protein
MNTAEGVMQREVMQSGVSLAVAASLPMPAADAMPGATSPRGCLFFWRSLLALLTWVASGGANLEALPASPDSRFQLAGILQHDDFRDGLSGWTLESERPAHVTATGGVLDIDAPAGLTLWLRPELEGPILIEYEAAAVSSRRHGE